MSIAWRQKRCNIICKLVTQMTHFDITSPEWCTEFHCTLYRAWRCFNVTPSSISKRSLFNTRSTIHMAMSRTYRKQQLKMTLFLASFYTCLFLSEWCQWTDGGDRFWKARTVTVTEANAFTSNAMAEGLVDDSQRFVHFKIMSFTGSIKHLAVFAGFYSK